VIVGISVSFAIPSIAVNERAAELGQQARSGLPVSPIEVLTVPIVDVAAPQVLVHWANPAVPPPRELVSTPEGILLGEAGHHLVVSVVTGTHRRLVRLNATSVVVELR
jgi:hypothetical protein